MQYLAFIALFAASTEAVPIVGSFTEDMMCKNYPDSLELKGIYRESCSEEDIAADPEACYAYKYLGDGLIGLLAADSWSAA